MPELAEQMYCSQQICIPPTFPYLLRQFAKAAIRTQPNDLLKWSTTYFRCLSLNIPPPVKPRLEYPIPKDFCGMTPGWLRALLLQMQGAPTVSFKLLWDRWIGACLQHNNLIQILCLGGFEDNTAVPWLRFIALCAGHLTDSLTQTMILICEILTEEPEGGSAMIPVRIFLDLYPFLARIDASVPQTLRNYYFLDKFLELYQEKIAKDQGVKEQPKEKEESASSEASSEMTMKTDKDAKKDDAGSVVSCPSVASQDPDNFMKMLMKIQEDELEEEAAAREAEERLEEAARLEEEKGRSQTDVESDEQHEEKAVEEKKEEEEPKPVTKFPADEETTTEPDDTESKDTKISSDREDVDEEKKDEDQFLLEDLQRLKMVQQELMGGESDDDVEKFKQSLLADMPITDSQLAAPDHFSGQVVDIMEVGSSESSAETVKADDSSSTGTEPAAPAAVEEREYEEVFVEAIPGIGGKVPDKIINEVCNYMKEVAKQQHGMVMPRNIRHFNCPPLEVVKQEKEK